MKAILHFARFLFSGCFVGDLGFILGGFAVVVCVRGVLSGKFCLGGFCPGFFFPGVLSGGVLSNGVLSTGGFVQRGFFSSGVLSGGFCPGGFCPRILIYSSKCVCQQNINCYTLIHAYHKQNAFYLYF